MSLPYPAPRSPKDELPPPARNASTAPPPPDSEHGSPLGFRVPPPATASRGRVITVAVVGVGMVAALVAIRLLSIWHAREALAAEVHESTAVVPRVQVISATVVVGEKTLSLPGSVQPLEETVLYPRANGYVRKWYVDLGAQVHEGDLLAEIDTPDLDQQHLQARAQLAQADASGAQARANANFSRQNLERSRQLVPEGLASQQDFDKAKAQADLDVASIGVAEATIRSQQANVKYLGQLKAFARVTAPFSGTITSRTVERGALVTAGTASPLFKLSAMDPVRVFVQVPQDVAAGVRIDREATISFREFPGRKFVGRIVHTAGALDPATRTMMTEVRVPNPKGEILTGMYTQVSLTLPTPHKVVSVPATALTNGAGGLRVAVVDDTSHVHLIPVVVERDTGSTIEIASGLGQGDRIVKLPSAELTEGRAVDVVP